MSTTQTIIAILWAGSCVICAVFGVLWGRKHPKLADQIAAEANVAKQKFGG